jgi:hypothetical protein
VEGLELELGVICAEPKLERGVFRAEEWEFEFGVSIARV